MGDPKSSRQKYEEPSHPWKGDRIEREDEYVRKYGLKNKKEFWKAESLLRQQRAQARQYLPLVLRDDEQGKKEAQQLLDKLHRLGILDANADLDDVLALDVDGILSRRLQTLTFLKGLANTPKQARQFITHGHIAVDGQTVDVPGYLVQKDEEDTIGYAPGSALRNEAHPIHAGFERPDAPGVGEADDLEGPGAGPDEEEADEEPEEADEAEPEEEPEEEAEEPEDVDEEEEADETEDVDEEEEADETEDADEGEEPDEAEEVDEAEPDEADDVDEAEPDEAEADEASEDGEAEAEDVDEAEADEAEADTEEDQS